MILLKTFLILSVLPVFQGVFLQKVLSYQRLESSLPSFLQGIVNMGIFLEMTELNHTID